jgi:KDO2-lipid IV(A) lauroyltransferase
MSPSHPRVTCLGLDTVETARIERLLAENPPEGLAEFFSERELEEAGTGEGRAASLAARFAAKEACCKLFPRETALGHLLPPDFSVERDNFGAPVMRASPRAQAVLDRHRISRLRVSLTHTGGTASAVAWAEYRETKVGWMGRFLYRFLPWRRSVVMGNLNRVFGDVLPAEEIVKLAQAYYAHYGMFLLEFFKRPFMSAKRRAAWIRVENMASPEEAHKLGKGLILLTGHFGNFEVATVAGIGQFPQYKGLFHFVRKELKPKFLNDFVTRRFRKAGFGTIGKKGSLDRILDLLAEGGIIVYVLDQHAGSKDSVVVDFFGHPAATFKSVALLAMTSGAPVIPAYSWREEDGSHVLRFEDPLPLIDHESVGEAIKRNTRSYNQALEQMLLRHPEQWIWMHRRWKASGG